MSLKVYIGIGITALGLLIDFIAFALGLSATFYWIFNFVWFVLLLAGYLLWYLWLRHYIGGTPEEKEVLSYEAAEEEAKDYAMRKDHIEIGHVIEDGTELVGREDGSKNTVYYTIFEEKDKQQQFGIAINMHHKEIRRFVRDPTKQKMQDLIQQMGDSKSMMATTVREVHNPMTGTVSKEVIQQPVQTQFWEQKYSKKKTEEDDSDE